MSDFLQMDIFFFITTVAVVVVGALIAFVLWRVQRILEDIEHISEQAAMESDLIRQDIHELRRDIKSGKGKVASVGKFVKSLTVKKHKKKAS
jgi:hypothetical protein